MSIFSRFKESRIRQFWLKYENKIVLAIGLILIAAISFEAGYLHGQKKNGQESVVVSQVACAPCPKNENTATQSAEDFQKNNLSNQNKADTEDQKCAFVASKNSNKYHLSTCQWAQKIKPENKICFPSAEEAQKRGYQGAKCCIK
jgi:hypothetical protein